MNTRQLRHFLAVLDSGSLIAAAETVHLSLPALSRSIRALEDGLGVPLFDRTDRRLQPTAYAYAYAPRARRMVLDEKEAIRTLDLMRTGDLGMVSMGMGSSLAEPVLRPMLAELLRTSPGVRLRSLIETSDRLLDALVAERLDFFVGDIRVAQGHPELAIEPLHRSTFGWYARTGHPLASQQGIDSKTLRQYPLIATGYVEPSLLQSLGQNYALSSPVLDHFSLITDDLGTVREIVASSDSIVPATDISMLAAMRSGAVMALDVMPPLELDMTLGIVRQSQRTLAPATEKAYGLVRSLFAAAAADISALRRAAAGPARGRSRSGAAAASHREVGG
ncbi:HTH-type transcriptional regulator CynR [Cupriavidus laharis]|uniref:HTH-type transcriptional regulator CynR n=1 Tax=Cupriavidus laharis TaxID=151654 RepID=A0ABN7ZD10_9BURK|nr:LysR family transcriptional regulator [Cupriavidus laharis]CAG9183098.1 HTH-type transcriptional regulator CynR [Cupriavidus laharis]